MISQFFQIKTTAKRFWSCLLILLLGGPLPASIFEDSSDTRASLVKFQGNTPSINYDKFKENINETSSFSREDINILRMLIARAFVDNQMAIVKEIVSILKKNQNSSDNTENVLQEVWSSQNAEFLFWIFKIFLNRRTEINDKNEIKRDNSSLRENWQELATYITSTNLPEPTISAHAFSELVRFSPDKQSFDIFMQLGEKQHKNDDQYWLDGYIDRNGKNKLTFLTRTLGMIFNRKETGLDDGEVKKALFDKITLDSKEGIYLLEKNNIIEDVSHCGAFWYITPSLFAMVCYYNPEDASALLETIKQQYELDKLEALKEVETQKNNGKPLSLQDRENNINMQAYYIGFLQSKPSIDYLNASFSFEPKYSEMKWVENALMAALNLDKKTPEQAESLVNKILDFEGIKVGQRHIDYVQNEYKSKKNIQDKILAKLNNLKEKNQEIMKCQDKLKKSDEVTNLTNQVKDLENKNKDLKSKLDTANNAIAEEKNKAVTTQKEFDDFRNSATNSNEVNKNLNATITQLQKDKEKLENSINENKKKEDNQKTEIANLNDRVKQIDNELKKANNDKATLEEEIKKEKKNAQEAKDNLKRYREAADRGQLADEVKQDIKNKEKKIEELEGQLTDKNKEVNDLGNDKNQLENKIKELEDNIQNKNTDSLNQENQDLKKKVKELEEKSKNSDTAALQEDNNNLKKEIENLKQKKPAEGDSINALKIQIKTIKEEKDTLVASQYKFKAYAWISSIVIIVMASLGFWYRAIIQKKMNQDS